MTKRFAFTLAEVLIALAIIGVVAAMTIPTLIANTNSAKFRSQFKKSLSTLNQAGLMAEAQFDFNYGYVEEACGDSYATQNPSGGDTKTFCAILNGTLTGATPSNSREGTLTKDAGLDATTPEIYYTLADGSMVAVPSFGGSGSSVAKCTLDIGTTLNATWIGDHKHCLGYIDVNGKTLPNKEVTCSKDASGADLDTPKATLDPSQACTVAADSTHMTDIYPVVFHDATVEPATDAAKAVLSTAK